MSEVANPYPILKSRENQKFLDFLRDVNINLTTLKEQFPSRDSLLSALRILKEPYVQNWLRDNIKNLVIPVQPEDPFSSEQKPETNNDKEERGNTTNDKKLASLASEPESAPSIEQPEDVQNTKEPVSLFKSSVLYADHKDSNPFSEKQVRMLEKFYASLQKQINIGKNLDKDRTRELEEKKFPNIKTKELEKKLYKRFAENYDSAMHPTALQSLKIAVNEMQEEDKREILEMLFGIRMFGSFSQDVAKMLKTNIEEKLKPIIEQMLRGKNG